MVCAGCKNLDAKKKKVMVRMVVVSTTARK